ncbi:uncharacterized protein L969DRAFT_84849 [Mixia osmundae IAM 14324]|uniref:Major facilitator superfamily (MFS) profile domain-containing protein n=1 Tax=Mixia osmundae (strain CBS 9802 / IAM 14324 / JCM 22182 / KY 12970) TaxID=764103 RepID=G7DXS2_MIXOS|nr:uncharacterized protein L969DRAFT_84849 [Mixia osmundae IAM 14324]KEI41131.1 hypothetical protein L969DRAFT_84849 [Mixia osmundae IAM 14324]GAA95382.1 hypothetical protein E5Q_02036 [Mixia osmundae IAM 14324]
MVWDGIARNHSEQYLHNLHRSRSRASSTSSGYQGSPIALTGSNTSAQSATGRPTLTRPLSTAPRRGSAIPEHHEGEQAGEKTQPPSSSDDETAAGDDLEANKDHERRLQLEKEGMEPEEAEARVKQEDALQDDPHLVTFIGREHMDPHTWNTKYRWFLTAFAGILVLNATFASSAPSNLLPSIDAYYGVSEEVGALLIAIFVLAYCVGPLVFGPMSEIYGRKPTLIASFIPYTAWQVGNALAPNIGSAIVFRFLGGCFASSPLTVSGGIIADLWGPNERGVALAIFSLAPFAGPAIAPIVSGFMEVTGTSWRWIYWVLTIFAGVCLVGIVVLLPETFIPIILKREAVKVRKETGDERYHASMERHEPESMGQKLKHTLLKPLIMLYEEPMLLAITLLMSYVYMIIYIQFESIPIIMGENHGLTAGLIGLTFLPIPLGGLAAVLIYVFYFNRRYIAKATALGDKPVPPEERLLIMMAAGPMLAVSFFWIGFTSYPSISIWSPIFGTALLGAGVLWVFLAGFTYLIDSYLANAASALAANTVMRSAFGAAAPLFATQMYNKLGIPGASSLLGGLAILFIPLPFVLFKYGRAIRARSKNAVVREGE